jgi:hypothetical protein
MKKLVAIALGVLAVLAIAGPALAHAGRQVPRLEVGSSDTGSIGWQRHVADSPLDPGRARLRLGVAKQDGDDYSWAQDVKTGIVGKDVSMVRNLSFDVLTSTYIGAGSPRLSVGIDTDGDLKTTEFYTYLSALYCQEPIPGSAWAVSDFVHDVDGCKFFADGVFWEADGARSAWTVFADAHDGARVTDAFLVMDEEGQSFVDRLTIQGHQHQGPTAAYRVHV